MTPNTFEPDVHKGEGCPVAVLGRMVGALDRRYTALDRLAVDESQKPGKGLSTYPENARHHTEDRRDDLRMAMAARWARSLEGCLRQVAQAESLLHDLFDQIKEPDWEAKRLNRTIERLLYSVAMRLEGAAGVTVEDVGMGMFMATNLNPWTSAEERMAWVQARNAEEAA